MPMWMQMTVQVVITVVSVLVALSGFWYLIVRPWLALKVQEIIQAAEGIEPKVTQGVQKGMADAVRQIPQNAWDGATKDSTKQFLKFGSSLFENGLSSFLGSAAEMQQARRDDGKAAAGEGESQR